MKVLITGKNSYIGKNIGTFLQYKGHEVKFASVRNGAKDLDFQDVEAVIHCAAIVHKKEKNFADQYEKVNYRLTIEIAKKAKLAGVKQFIFLSSMSVYGKSSGEINKNTPTTPTTLYGKSKLMAEKALEKMESKGFTVSIVRPPMVYGAGCGGNYCRLRKLVRALPIFPMVENKRSFIYVENLCFFISNLLESNSSGVYMPMDEKCYSTDTMAKYILQSEDREIKLSSKFGKLVKIIKISPIQKAFGSLYYGDDVATRVDFVPFEKAIECTERNFE